MAEAVVLAEKHREQFSIVNLGWRYRRVENKACCFPMTPGVFSPKHVQSSAELDLKKVKSLKPSSIRKFMLRRRQ